MKEKTHELRVHEHPNPVEEVPGFGRLVVVGQCPSVQVP